MPFEHVRHRTFAPLSQPRELIVACAPMRSNVNLSRIVRAAGCCGVRQVICCGTAKIIGKIARDSVDDSRVDDGPADDTEASATPPGVEIQVHRTLAPTLLKLKREGYRLVGLEQTSDSQPLYGFPFERRTVLVVGNERQGLDDEILRLLDAVVEIPVYGPPHAHNVATATAMALYEFCRLYPGG